MQTEREGTIEKIEYTAGGFGNQFTTIDGRRYWTWWDIRNPAIGVGNRVCFTEHLHAKVWDEPLVYGDVASNFRLAVGK